MSKVTGRRRVRARKLFGRRQRTATPKDVGTCSQTAANESQPLKILYFYR